MHRRKGYYWKQYWGFFRDTDQYASELLQTRGQNDKVVSDEIVRVLREERLRVRLRYPLRAARLAWMKVRGIWYKWKNPPEPKSSLAEALGEKLATDPKVAGFTEAGKEALTKAKKKRSE